MTAVHVGGGGVRPDHAQRCPIGGRREACGAWLRGTWAAVGPGRIMPGAARLEDAAGPAGPGRASRRGTERGSVAKSRGRAGLAAAGNLAAQQPHKKVMAPRKTWGPPLMRSLA